MVLFRRQLLLPLLLLLLLGLMVMQAEVGHYCGRAAAAAAGS